MRYVGLDLSTTRSGLAIIYDYGKQDVLSFKHKHTKSPTVAMYQAWIEEIGERIFFGDVVFQEIPVIWHKNAVFPLIEFGICMRMHLYQKKQVLPFLINPGQVKSFFGQGKKIKGKQLLAALVAEEFGQTFENDDELDAWCLAYMASQLSVEGLPEHRSNILIQIIGDNPHAMLQYKANKELIP